MALERIHLYNLVRVLRVVVPFLVAAFAVVFVWSYIAGSGDVVPDAGEPRLEQNMSRMSEGVTYSQAREGCTLYTVTKSRDLGFEGGINQLEEVEVILGACGTSPERRIRGELCGVRQQGEGAAVDIQCQGAVEVDLDPQTVVRTERLAYQYPSEIITSDAPVEIARAGQFEIHADRMTAEIGKSTFALEGGVEVVRPDGSRLDAAELRYDEGSGQVTAAGGFRLDLETLSVSGRQGRAHLAPETLALAAVEVRGEVEARSRERGRMSSEALDLEFQDGRARVVRARGSVVVESGESEGSRTLSGDSVFATLDPAGALETLESTGDAEMRLGTGETIRSGRIVQTPGGGILTEGDSVLEAGEVTVEGSGFRIAQGALVEFETDEFARILSPSGVFEGARTRASFDPESGTLERLEQSGGARLELDELTGSGETVAIDETWVELTGSARLEDAEFELRSRTVRLPRSGGSLEANGSVFLVARREDGPVFVESDRLQGDFADTLHFSGGVVLRQGRSEVRADRMDVDPDGRSFVAEGSSESVMDDLLVRADSLRFDDANGRVEYSGDVYARTDELTLDSRVLELTMVDDEIDRIDAGGDVRVISAKGLEGFGEAAVYIRSEGTLTLTGPGAEAVDPARGRCAGDEIVVDVLTGDLRVLGGEGARTTCSTIPQG